MEESIRGKRILITGIAGFIGANLARRLLGAGAAVHGIVRPATGLWRLSEIAPAVQLHYADLADRKELEGIAERTRPEIIFHLAVRGLRTFKEDTLDILRTNVEGTVNLLEATKPCDYECFVHLGSSTEYGQKGAPSNESDWLEPATFYGAAKAAATFFAQQFARANRRPVVILRPFSVYGQWEGGKRLIPTAIMAVLRGGEISLTPAGYRRDFVFVEDVCEACILAAGLKESRGEIINVGTGEQWSNEEAVEMIQTLLGRKIRVKTGEYLPRATDTKNWVADIGKAKKLLGWEPRHTLKTGLEKTIDWFKANRSYYE